MMTNIPTNLLLQVVATLLTLAECMSIGDTEIVRSSYGFYGLPNYRYLNRQNRNINL